MSLLGFRSPLFSWKKELEAIPLNQQIQHFWEQGNSCKVHRGQAGELDKISFELNWFVFEPHEQAISLHTYMVRIHVCEISLSFD